MKKANQPPGMEEKQTHTHTSRYDQTASPSAPVEEILYFQREGGQKSSLKRQHLHSLQQGKADWFFTSCTTKGRRVAAMIQTNGNLSYVAISRQCSRLACTTSPPTIRIHLSATLLSPEAAVASLRGESCEKKVCECLMSSAHGTRAGPLTPRPGRAGRGGNALVWEI